jgi:protein-tyrosine kinase
VGFALGLNGDEEYDMSIIEKAVDKLGKPGVQPVQEEARAIPVEPAQESFIEKISERVAQPVAAMSAAPVHTAALPVTDENVRHQITISTKKLNSMGMITLDSERSQIAEEYRLIKRPLLLNAFGHGAAPVHNGNMIMVTSALPGEGKTFCSINLALSIAMELDRTVLLVDADVAKPSVLRYLGAKAEKGLLDVLQDEKLTLADVLIKTNIENLTILPAGHTYKQATELLASDAMNDLIEEIASRYPDRIVIFDSPPLLVTTEASVLASHMGQIVLVVAAESTPQQAVKEALARIEGACDVIGTLLNKATPIPGSDYYYGNYGNYGT